MAKGNHPKRACSVDLTSVTFVDHAGRYLLQLMHCDGVRLVASSLMLQDILDHVAGRAGRPLWQEDTERKHE